MRYSSTNTQHFLLLGRTGEGRLEVRCHGDRPHLPVDVHHRVPAGHHRPVPPALAGRNDLEEEAAVSTTMTPGDP